MIIDIKDGNKASITHALRVAIGRINSSLETAFSNFHPDRHDLNWYKRVEDDICVMKQLKQLIDNVEEAKGEVK